MMEKVDVKAVTVRAVGTDRKGAAIPSRKSECFTTSVMLPEPRTR
jgi:hypothetical protein